MCERVNEREGRCGTHTTDVKYIDRWYKPKRCSKAAVNMYARKVQDRARNMAHAEHVAARHIAALRHTNTNMHDTLCQVYMPCGSQNSNKPPCTRK